MGAKCYSALGAICMGAIRNSLQVGKTANMADMFSFECGYLLKRITNALLILIQATSASFYFTRKHNIAVNMHVPDKKTQHFVKWLPYSDNWPLLGDRRPEYNELIICTAKSYRADIFRDIDMGVFRKPDAVLALSPTSACITWFCPSLSCHYLIYVIRLLSVLLTSFNFTCPLISCYQDVLISYNCTCLHGYITTFRRYIRCYAHCCAATA